MKTIKASTLIALSILFFASCTIEKRLYNKGLHVEWKKKYKKSGGALEKEDVAVSSSRETEEHKEVIFQETESRIIVNDEVLTQEDGAEGPVSEGLEKSTQNIKGNQIEIAPESEEGKQEKKAVKANKQNAKKQQKQSEGSSGKSQIIALVLVILVGVLGIHRFYLGYTGIGILMLLTAGCCGILALIDLIRIILGDLKPKDGDYSEKL